ncbi:MAG: zinc-dependent metalloprotease, partial [Arenimonas sp.]|nr:zinc-dependent metalloprotease [Arenimonas sp.]
MRRAIPALLALALLSPTLPATAAPAGSPAFMAVQANPDSGKVLIDIPAWNQPFLMVATLENALGSNDIGLDRAANGNPLLVEFRRIGQKAFLVQRNTAFVADSTDPDEARAAKDAFAESVLWAGPIVAGTPARVDISALLLADWVGVAERLQATEQGSYRLDGERSSVVLDEARSFPDNSDFTALLTFTGPGQGQYVQQVAANPQILSVKQRISFVRLPAAGFTPRAYHPASGGFSISRYDFAQPITRNIEVRLQPRFRLVKTDPSAARSTVVKPIVFYLDRGTPEPIRSALLEGANWWSEAFEAAGFIGAFRAELAPPGMSMSDARYNTITWTHRATRGWSYGGGLIDPGTGEIIKGYVNLGSQRVRQDLLIAEGILAPYKPGADPALLNEAQQMALQRLRQLAAHEVGHALGFAHNFAASRAPTGSVLDYPHPQISLAADGQPRMSTAYDSGVGAWDKFAVAHAYGVFTPAQEQAALAKLRSDISAKGYQFISDGDARSLNNAHEAGLLWDVPGDALQGLQQLLAVRQVALNNFAAGALPPDRQLGDAERRLVPIYLLHRYQAEAAVRLLGGNSYAYGLIGDT